jgi:hypothetical protein
MLIFLFRAETFYGVAGGGAQRLEANGGQRDQ